jgi:hypothetical protein
MQSVGRLKFIDFAVANDARSLVFNNFLVEKVVKCIEC